MLIYWRVAILETATLRKLRYSPQSSAATDAWNLATDGSESGKSTLETHENSSGAQLFIDVLHILQMMVMSYESSYE